MTARFSCHGAFPECVLYLVSGGDMSFAAQHPEVKDFFLRGPETWGFLCGI